VRAGGLGVRGCQGGLFGLHLAASTQSFRGLGGMRELLRGLTRRSRGAIWARGGLIAVGVVEECALAAMSTRAHSCSVFLA